MSRSSGPLCASSDGVFPAGEREIVWIRDELLDALRHICVEALPGQAYGLVGGSDLQHPLSLHPCSSNLRNSPEWTAVFDRFGEFNRDPDRGFVIAPDEIRAVTTRMAARGESPVGVFHSHRYRRAEPSPTDIALGHGSDLLSYIVSVMNRDAPEVRVFRLSAETRHEEVQVIRRSHGLPQRFSA